MRFRQRETGSVKSVALRKESVDRNADGVVSGSADYVALRKESVDRNTNPGSTTLTFPVALRKESVDRNRQALPAKLRVFWSLSVRRAWIEIEACPPVP